MVARVARTSVIFLRCSIPMQCRVQASIFVFKLQYKNYTDTVESENFKRVIFQILGIFYFQLTFEGSISEMTLEQEG